MKNVYPEYADQVAFYAVGTDPNEAVERLEGYRQQQGYPWPVAVAQGAMLRDLNVLVQSTKVVFDSRGVQVYRAGFGQGGPDEWRKVFEDLASES
ncbi:MAG: hypothetical protein O2909_09250 [Chloroflexi bacterium]|nr:hypothetical protein [Chloroflexota bacterium]MDA1219612.1 hypothetical protein [Chloroflexota bacterium]